ncbi:MAG: hypothetical protein KAS38_13315 [Anaerolineales bacterium]|nr:hypothetical protein [Anaerolineales bacterium]
MIRKLIYISLSIIGVLAVAILGLVALLITETGNRWLIQQAATHVPDELTIRRIQGSVFSGLNLYGVEYRIYNQHTQIQHVELSLQPIALLGGTVHFLSLHIQGLTYTAPEVKDIFTKDTIQVLPDISFPLAVVVDEARLDHLDFRLGNNRHTLDYVHMAGRVDRNGLQLKKLEAQGEGLHVNIQGRTSLHQPYPFQVNLNWSAQLPNGVQARGECDINGDADAVKFIHKLNAPFTIETLGEVKANSKLTEFNLTGSQPKVNWPLTGEAGCQGENRQYG